MARHDQSLNDEGCTNPANTPVAPITRPRPHINNVADSPIKTPPPSDAKGVNSVSICLSFCDLYSVQRKTRAGKYQGYNINYMQSGLSVMGDCGYPKTNKSNVTSVGEITDAPRQTR
jgi:hypothetical protein